MRIRSQLQMGRVFTNISHELLTPLTVIAALVERLREEEPRFAADYTQMELNVERMTRLLQQILETSKSQSGELRLLVSHGDVMEYIRRTALCIEPLMHKQGVEFTIQCTPASMMGWIDIDKLDKIIYNLLSNAAKYTSSPGHVRLQVHTNDNFDHITIKVIDDGIGISPEKMKHLFHRFHDGAYRRMQVSGTGLGLALTRDLVFLHGGNISCESEEGKGSTFTVVLPIAKKSFTTSQIDDKHPIDLSTPRTTIKDLSHLTLPEEHPIVATELPDDAYRILLVEDNVELLMLMDTLLCHKYKILTATNGREALDVIKNNELDLIVSDVMMPEMDGNELTMAIKGDPELSHLPVILLTAKTTEDDRKASMVIGADDYVVKPFHLSDLTLRINNIIENRKRIRYEAQLAQNTEDDRPLTADELFLKKATECVMEHLSDADFDRDAFAAEMGASPSTLYNKLRALTGLNVSNFIRDIRMKEARRLVDSLPDLRVSDLAYKVGFRDPKYFATCFKKEFGIQPSELLRGN
ncbi:MAG: response regulator [Prevotella sp.]|nr:response regulator [Prevotella sp.]